MEQIAARFACSPATIRRRMDDLGIEARPRGPNVGERNSDWSSEMAYAVGLIASDGNLSGDGRHLSITSADYDLLETARTCLGLNVSITPTANSTGQSYFRLQWGNRKFYDWLLGIGLMPAKSLRLSSLAIPADYMADFVRGCIDGDGSIRTYTDRYNTFKSEKYVYQRLYVSLVSGSRPFLEWLHAYLGNQLTIRGGIYESRRNRSIYWRLKYMKNDSIRLLKWMYYDLDVPCLARKRDIARPYLMQGD